MNSFPPELPPEFEVPRFDRPGMDEVTALPRRTGSPGRRVPVAIDRQWLALHRAAAAVASLGEVPPEQPTAKILAFPERASRTAGWRAGLARQGVADLAAVMEPGLTALIAVHNRGADPVPAAQALLQEFSNARDALLALIDEDLDHA